MNPLTQIKNTQKISREEVAAGYTDSQSWHARFKHSAYIFTGGLPYKLTDGDLLAIFSQYGEIIDVNLVRHKETGKPRGFAFLAYEDQRSTNLAVDNLNGMKVGGRMITVDHVDNYKRKRAEAEGREESESEEEEAMDDENAEAAAVLAAAGDGAQVVSQHDAEVQPRGEDEDAPWAAKTSVHALLNSALPAHRPATAEEEEEDPMALLLEQKKSKKEKKEKKKKDKKEKREKKHAKKDSSEDGSPARRITDRGDDRLLKKAFDTGKAESQHERHRGDRGGQRDIQASHRDYQRRDEEKSGYRQDEIRSNPRETSRSIGRSGREDSGRHDRYDRKYGRNRDRDRN